VSSERPPRVVDYVNAALADRSPPAVVGALVQAARACAEADARGDVRDGLIDMPLAFRAAELLGLDVDHVVEQALIRLEPAAAAQLRAYAGRPDRCDVRCMGWDEVSDRAGVRFAGWGA
jgi:hypothetical protein